MAALFNTLALGGAVGVGSIGYSLFQSTQSRFGSTDRKSIENRRLLAEREYSMDKYSNSGPAGASILGGAGIGIGFGAAFGLGGALGVKRYMGALDKIPEGSAAAMKKVAGLWKGAKSGADTSDMLGPILSGAGRVIGSAVSSNSSRAAVGVFGVSTLAGGIVGAQTGATIYEQGMRSSIHNYLDSKGGSDVMGASATAKPITLFGAATIAGGAMGVFGGLRTMTGLAKKFGGRTVRGTVANLPIRGRGYVASAISTAGSTPVAMGIAAAAAYGATNKMYNINQDPSRSRIQGIGR